MVLYEHAMPGRQVIVAGLSGRREVMFRSTPLDPRRAMTRSGGICWLDGTRRRAVPASAPRRAPVCYEPGLGLLHGVRPSRDVVRRLVAGLRAERRALDDLRGARAEIVAAIAAGRAEGASFTALACAVVPGSGSGQVTAHARARMAANLRSRVWEARRAQRTAPR